MLLRLKDQPEQMREVRDRIVNQGLSVRAAERLCAKTPPPAVPKTGEGGAAGVEELPQSYCAALVNQLTNRQHFVCPVGEEV